MEPIRYDESLLRAGLARLPRKHRAAFAAACAERLFPAYVRFAHEARRGDPEALRTALNLLWDDLAGNPVSELTLRASAEKCLALVPREDEEPWVESQPSADDAAAALVYAIQSMVTDGTQEAAWSARRAYDALDRVVMDGEPGIVVTELVAQRVLEHPLVQAELLRQRRDLDDLLGLGDRDVRELAAQLRDRSKEEAGVFFRAPS